MRRRNVDRRLNRLHQSGEALVRVGNANHVVQDALIDAQRAGGECRAAGRFDELPMPKGRSGGEGAPVSVRQRGEREAKRRVGSLGVAVCGGAEWRERGVELDTGTENERIALEPRQPERADELRERRWERLAGRYVRNGGRRGVGGGRTLGRCAVGRRMTCVALQRGAYSIQCATQLALIGFVPAHRVLRDFSAHDMTYSNTCVSLSLGATALCTGEGAWAVYEVKMGRQRRKLATMHRISVTVRGVTSDLCAPVLRACRFVPYSVAATKRELYAFPGVAECAIGIKAGAGRRRHAPGPRDEPSR